MPPSRPCQGRAHHAPALTVKLLQHRLGHGSSQLGALLHGVAEVHAAPHARVVHLLHSLRGGGGALHSVWGAGDGVAPHGYEAGMSAHGC